MFFISVCRKHSFVENGHVSLPNFAYDTEVATSCRITYNVMSCIHLFTVCYVRDNHQETCHS